MHDATEYLLDCSTDTAGFLSPELLALACALAVGRGARELRLETHRHGRPVQRNRVGVSPALDKEAAALRRAAKRFWGALHRQGTP